MVLALTVCKATSCVVVVVVLRLIEIMFVKCFEHLRKVLYKRQTITNLSAFLIKNVLSGLWMLDQEESCFAVNVLFLQLFLIQVSEEVGQSPTEIDGFVVPHGWGEEGKLISD